MLFNSWDFFAREVDGEVVFKVTPDNELIVPSSLSKYYELNQRNIIALVNNQFYVSYPENLNDLFELNSELIDFSKLDFDYFKDIFNYFEKDNSLDLRADFETKPLEYLKELRNLFYTKFISSFGVLCTTDNQYNDLMWAHYSNNKGFLVEYNTEKFDKNLYKGPFPINYISNLNSHTLNKGDVIFEVFFALFMSKKEIWKYEREYRFFCLPSFDKLFKVEGRFSNINLYSDLEDRYVSYPKESINKIILGFSFYASDVVLNGANSSANVYFSGSDGLLKSKLFDEIIRRKINVEVIGIGRSSFNLGSKPVNIRHLGGFNYSVNETQPIAKS